MKNMAHPFLFVLFFLLFFVGQNPTTIPIFLSTLLIVLLFSALCLFLHKLVLKNKIKASIQTTFFLFLFFSMGQLCILFGFVDFQIGKFMIGPHKFFIVFAFASYVLLFIILAKTRRELNNVAAALSFILGLLVLLNIGQIVINNQAFLTTDHKKQIVAKNTQTKDYPNFYFLLMDGFAGHDVLKTTFHHDNSDFLKALEQRGFFVSWDSNSNYAQTLLSLSSNFNLRYIDIKKENIYPSRKALYQFFMTNDVFKYLKEKGYAIHAFSTGYNFTEFKHEHFHTKYYYIDEFQQNLLMMTMLYTVQNSVLSDMLFNVHHARIENTFRLLPTLSFKDEHIFVFAHMLCPHPPFIYAKDGTIKKHPYAYSISDCSHLTELINYPVQSYQKNYVEQLEYCEMRLLKSVDDILAHDKNAVIILQSDHGPGSTIQWDEYDQTNFDERMSILYSVYLPNQNYSHFYQGISSVNTFRMMFNTCFDESYPALPDSSYWSAWKTPFLFKNVTAAVQ